MFDTKFCGKRWRPLNFRIWIFLYRDIKFWRFDVSAIIKKIYFINLPKGLIMWQKSHNYALKKWKLVKTIVNLYSPNSLLIILMVKWNIVVLKIREWIIQKWRNNWYVQPVILLLLNCISARITWNKTM